MKTFTSLCFASICATLGVTAQAADITPESYPGSCTLGTDDTGCWQAALAAASPTVYPSFTVAGSSGKTYIITNTLKLCNANSTTIDGHGATLEWRGPSNVPMFLVINSYQTRFQNLKIVSSTFAPKTPLDTAFEFTSAPNNGVDAACTGTLVGVSSKNSLDHVTVEGVSLGGLNYGVRFSNRYGHNASNDMSLISDSDFHNVAVAAVSIEHNQSHHHRLNAVRGYGAAGNTEGCFVKADTGYMTATATFAYNWNKADFCLDNAFGPFDIVDSNSEGSTRMVEYGPTGRSSNFATTLNVLGGRFGVDGLHADGGVISVNRLGSVMVRGLRVIGAPPVGVQPRIAVEPSYTGPNSTASSAIIEGVVFHFASSNLNPTIVAKSFLTLTATGNVCEDATNAVAPCVAPLRTP